jgi:hypothetical protein
MRVIMIALVTLLIGGAVVAVVVFQNSRPDNVPTAPGARALGTFFAEEHMAAARSSSHDDFVVRTPEELRGQTSAWIGRQMEFEETLLASDSGLRFIGAREVNIPGPGRSAHLLFATDAGVWASVFLQQYLAKPELEMNEAYSLDVRGLGAPVVVWRPGGQIHYLVSEQPEGVATLRRALGIPEPARRYR